VKNVKKHSQESVSTLVKKVEQSLASSLAKMATSASKDKMIFTALGYDRKDAPAILELKNTLQGFFTFILIKAKDIGKEITAFMLRLTETGRSL
jgi:hypothetical protein